MGTRVKNILLCGLIFLAPAFSATHADVVVYGGTAAGGVDSEPLRAVVWVERAPTTDVPQAFDTFRGGATLQLATATMDAATGDVTVGAPTDLSAACGLSGADVRGPSVSWDGSKLAFAARTSASTPLEITVSGLPARPRWPVRLALGLAALIVLAGIVFGRARADDDGTAPAPARS